MRMSGLSDQFIQEKRILFAHNKYVYNWILNIFIVLILCYYTMLQSNDAILD